MKLILKFKDPKYNKEVEIDSMDDVYTTIDKLYGCDTFNGYLRVPHPVRGDWEGLSNLEHFEIGKEYILDTAEYYDDCTIWDDKEYGTLRIEDENTLKLEVDIYNDYEKHKSAIINSTNSTYIHDILNSLYWYHDDDLKVKKEEGTFDENEDAYHQIYRGEFAIDKTYTIYKMNHRYIDGGCQSVLNEEVGQLKIIKQE